MNITMALKSAPNFEQLAPAVFRHRRLRFHQKRPRQSLNTAQRPTVTGAGKVFLARPCLELVHGVGSFARQLGLGKTRGEEMPDLPKAVVIPRHTCRRSATVKLVVCLWLGVGAVQVLAESLLLHKMAPEFVRTDLKHRRLDLRDYRGKIVLLNFWATWCAPCQREMPRFVAWQTQYGSRGLQIIGISMDDDSSAVRGLIKKLRLNYPVAMGDEQLGRSYGGVLGLPLSFLIDSQGKVQAQYQGETDLNSIEKQFRPLLHP
jgi:cytochrome c biogenesis protein CcmG/thiol:disulfide interchange protein DsbE